MDNFASLDTPGGPGGVRIVEWNQNQLILSVWSSFLLVPVKICTKGFGLIPSLLILQGPSACLLRQEWSSACCSGFGASQASLLIGLKKQGPPSGVSHRYQHCTLLVIFEILFQTKVRLLHKLYFWIKASFLVSQKKWHYFWCKLVLFFWWWWWL